MVKSEIIKFTVIAPVFCEEESLRELVNRIEQTFAGMGEKESFAGNGTLANRWRDDC